MFSVTLPPNAGTSVTPISLISVISCYGQWNCTIFNKPAVQNERCNSGGKLKLPLQKMHEKSQTMQSTIITCREAELMLIRRLIFLPISVQSASYQYVDWQPLSFSYKASQTRGPTISCCGWIRDFFDSIDNYWRSFRYFAVIDGCPCGYLPSVVPSPRWLSLSPGGCPQGRLNGQRCQGQRLWTDRWSHRQLQRLCECIGWVPQV